MNASVSLFRFIVRVGASAFSRSAVVAASSPDALGDKKNVAKPSVRARVFLCYLLDSFACTSNESDTCASAHQFADECETQSGSSTGDGDPQSRYRVVGNSC